MVRIAMRLALALALTAVAAILLATSSEAVETGGGKKVLVLLDSLTTKETHSMFFRWLASDRGFEVAFKTADDPSINIKKHGQFLYDHLVLFCPSVEEFGGSLSAEGVADFVDGGGNVLVAGNHQTGDLLRELASEFGFEVDEEGTQVIDHLNFDVRDGGSHTLIVADPRENLIKAPAIVGGHEGQPQQQPQQQPPLLYRGTGLIVDRKNPLVLQILSGSASAYSYNPSQPVTQYPHSVGQGTVMVAGLQAMNNARVVFSGSLDFFSDELFSSPVEKATVGNVNKKWEKSGNEEVARNLALWCFRHAGVLRTKSVSHHLAGETEARPFYTIKEDVVYTIEIEEYKDNEWVPFTGTDVQLEFHRIDPFVRTTLKNENGRLTAHFMLPDVYGVYQFKVDYDRVGMTRLFSSTQVPVRPLRHNQYERFIVAAYPYYASSFSMMFGVFIFSIIYLNFKDTDDTAKSKKE